MSTYVKYKINRFSQLYFNCLSIEIVLTPFKVADMINVKDQISNSLKSFVVYKLVCQG